MPEIPIVVPLIIIGLVVGGIVKSKTPRISKKKLGSASLAAGLLNSVYAYLIYSMAPTKIAAGAAGVPQGGPTMPTTMPTMPTGLAPTSMIPFVASSFLAAFLIVLLVFGFAAAYARVGKKAEFEEAAEPAPEEEPALAS